MDETAKLSLQEIQAIEFSMLEFLDSVCVDQQPGGAQHKTVL